MHVFSYGELCVYTHLKHTQPHAFSPGQHPCTRVYTCACTFCVSIPKRAKTRKTRMAARRACWVSCPRVTIVCFACLKQQLSQPANLRQQRGANCSQQGRLQKRSRPRQPLPAVVPLAWKTEAKRQDFCSSSVYSAQVFCVTFGQLKLGFQFRLDFSAQTLAS